MYNFFGIKEFQLVTNVKLVLVLKKNFLIWTDSQTSMKISVNRVESEITDIGTHIKRLI